MGSPNRCSFGSPLAGLWVHSRTALTKLGRAYRSLTVLRGLTVIDNEVIVGVGRGTDYVAKCNTLPHGPRAFALSFLRGRNVTPAVTIRSRLSSHSARCCRVGMVVVETMGPAGNVPVSRRLSTW